MNLHFSFTCLVRLNSFHCKRCIFTFVYWRIWLFSMFFLLVLEKIIIRLCIHFFSDSMKHTITSRKVNIDIFLNFLSFRIEISDILDFLVGISCDGLLINQFFDRVVIAVSSLNLGLFLKRSSKQIPKPTQLLLLNFLNTMLNNSHLFLFWSKLIYLIKSLWSWCLF